MTQPIKQPRPFDEPDTEDFASERDEAWVADQSPEKTEEPESPDGRSGLEPAKRPD